MYRLVDAIYRKTVSSHCLKVRAPGDEGHIGAALREAGSEIAADPAGSHNRYPQAQSPGFRFPHDGANDITLPFRHAKV
jgi:hypothetical protein